MLPLDTILNTVEKKLAHLLLYLSSVRAYMPSAKDGKVTRRTAEGALLLTSMKLQQVTKEIK